MARPRIEVNLEELDQVLEEARQAPLSEDDYQKRKTVLHALAEWARSRSTEKTKAVLGETEDRSKADADTPGLSGAPGGEPAGASPGHGRNGAEAFRGAKRVEIAHPKLKHGDRCPGCDQGNVYRQKEARTLVRIVGQAPLEATLYALERLRCNACGEIYTAEAPEGVGPERYDETAAAMIAQLKYGSGTPFYRLAHLERHLGIPLPAATQWEVVAEAAELIRPARDELIRQAAQGEVLYNDDTSMKVLRLVREPGDERTGVFTSGIVSTRHGQKIALFFTGRQHAGENLAEVLKRRAAELTPAIQMCDALSRNVPKFAGGVEILVAHCLAHGRRQFVNVAGSFPDECRYVLEALGKVYGHEAMVRKRALAPPERLRFHQEHSGPVMQELHRWLEVQLAEHKTEPNSGLGKAITYLLRHWNGLTAFLREPRAPLDNNLCERALKRAVLHRKNALFYRTLNGAQVGDLYMSLIHTCQLCGANSFDYLSELQRHAKELASQPAAWMPWNYHQTLQRTAAG